jgi:hypothetical protein
MEPCPAEVRYAHHFGAFLATEDARWSAVVKTAGVHIE